MKGVADLSTFILASLRDEEAGRVALYHYLKNFQSQETEVTPSLINEFFGEALQLHHWQQKKEALYTDIYELLQRFLASTNEPFRLEHVWDLTRLQLVTLEQTESLSQAVYEYEQNLLQNGEEIRIIMESPTRALALIRNSEGGMTARSFSNLARISGNRLLPLGPDQEIFYDASLELMKDRVQKLRLSAHGQVRFISTPDGINAQFITGYAFRQTQSIKIPNLNHEPRLFYPLKRLERFFVHRPSDPYYMEILGTLDRAVQMLQIRAEGARAFALQAFDSGQIAFDQIFPDDKPLYSRLRELAKLVSVPHSPGKSPEELGL